MELIILVISLIAYSSGFLLDGRTQPTPTDNPNRQVNMVMNMVINERIERQKQDQIIAQLQKELLTTQQEITTSYHSINRNNSYDEKRLIELENRSNVLQNEANFTKIKYNALEQENAELKKNVSILLKRSQQQENIYIDLKNEFNQLEQEVLSLRQLKTISELQTVYKVWNETKHLEHEIQKTNSLLNSVVNDANARKHDFLALFEKVEKTERELKSRVALTASPVENTYINGQIIQFTDIRLRNGINNTSSLKEHGNFIFEKSGIYLILIYITTHPPKSHFNVYLNEKFIGDSFSSLTSYYQTSSYTSIQQANVNDTLIVKGYDTYVYSNMESALSILQIL